MGNRKANIVGIDIGGSKIEAIFWKNGKIATWQRIKTPTSRKSLLAAVFELIESMREKHKLQGIGISLAGAIDMRSGTVVHSPNLRFLHGMNLQNLVEKKFRIPVRVKNDTQCFLLGEIHFGQAKAKKNVIGMIIGTGLGGALYLNSQLVTGAHGFAGEQGMAKLIVNRNALRVEDLISSHGFRRLGVSKPLEYQNRAMRGDKKAIAIYDAIGKYLGIHLANLIEIFDPELIIIGGGISRAGNILLRPALAEMKKHVATPKRYWPAIKISKLKNAGLLGAVSLFTAYDLPHVKGENKRG